MRTNAGMGVDLQGGVGGDTADNERRAVASRTLCQAQDVADASDATLANRTVAGDREALTELYRRHAHNVAAVCRSRGPAGETDDLVQDAFTALLTRETPLTDPANVRGWLLRTARNLAIDAVRAHRNSHTQHLDHTTPTAPATASPEADTLDRIVVHELLADFAHDRDAALIHDHLIRDTPLRTLADRSGTTYGAIKVKAHRARKRLAALADAHGIRAALPLPLTRLADRLHRFLRADAATTGFLVPIAVVIGVTATTAGAQPPPTPSVPTSVAVVQYTGFMSPDETTAGNATLDSRAATRPSRSASDSETERTGGQLVASSDLVPSTKGPVMLDRSRLRITILSPGRAVEVTGCNG